MDSNNYNYDELTHWGVRGMKWGVRRYQNKDGSLTDAGKKKLRAEQAKVREEERVVKNRKAVQNRIDRLEARKKAVAEEKKELDARNPKAQRKAEKEAKKQAAENGKKSIKDMTDEELLAAVNRARLEDSYNQLRPQAEKHPLMKKLTNDVVIPAAVNSGKKFLENALNKAAEKVLGDKADPNSIEALKKTADKLDLQNRIAKAKAQMEKRNKGENPDDDMSIEDQSKKTKLQWEKEDRDARSRGFKDAPDEAAQKLKTQASTSYNKKTVNAFVSKVQNKPVSQVSSERTRKRVQNLLESEDYDFENWGRYDLNASRWDDD